MKKHITQFIRSSFLDYFGRNDHVIVPASSLLPRNDPSLMFTNSGMVQFKNYLSGAEKPPFPRAATAQKAVRAGGKHNDLENVGHTVRHHTLFEMLGNFSFGDYFKEKAIFYAWEFLTRELELDKKRLLATIYHTDEEAYLLWKKIAGLPDENIIRIATKDNFWQMADVGPCGPCSEIFYDHGDAYAGGRPGTPDEDGDRYIEIWNLVFDQFEDLPDGRRIETPDKSIDTGAGLERLSAVLHGTNDNFKIDIFRELIETAAEAARVSPDGAHKVSLRVIADHLRATSFLIADGVLPDNEGRGYVLRRIMRRAMRHAHLIGAREPLMHRLVPTLVASMGDAYPELKTQQALIESTLKQEEERFRLTLGKGLKLLADETGKLKDGAALSGAVAFKLYDTYGFPLDLTQDVLRVQNRAVDQKGFDKAMEKQRADARKSWVGSGDAADEKSWFKIAEKVGATAFVGYEADTAEAPVLALVKEEKEVAAVQAGDAVSVVVASTPFYGEMGGQIGDIGILRTRQARVRISNTLRRADGALVVHQGIVEEGALRVGDQAHLEINAERRFRIRAHHSATHLLQAALRQVLGKGVHQKGSVVSDDGFRFDFAYPQALTPAEIAAVEDGVNQMIVANQPILTEVKMPAEAAADGALALFGEKYGATVRVISMGAGDKRFSCELCGGTHASRTGDIGLFRILSESGISAGVRRIEAVVGLPAVQQTRQKDALLKEIQEELKAPTAGDVKAKIAALLAEKKQAEKEIALLRQQAALGGGTADTPRQAGQVPFVGKILRGTPAKELKPLVDVMKQKIGAGVVAVLAEDAGKVSVVIGVAGAWVGKINAVELAQKAAAIVGGKGGGGRPDMAQAGGTDPQEMARALEEIEKHIAAVS